ncbi:hypothetical protein CB1_001573009 [Camelus ferus]|nr:hypothetical protein CB1_001573009 [Camelus ferus]
MSGTAADISLVHWRQQWLENGTLYFHVSMSSSGQLARATAPTLQEPSEIVEEQMHILHISVMMEKETRKWTFSIPTPLVWVSNQALVENADQGILEMHVRKGTGRYFL